MAEKQMQAAALNLSAMDVKFAAEILTRPGGEHLFCCFACGTCTLTCPVAEVTDSYNPRGIIRRILLGQKEEVLSDLTIWYCRTCFRCSVHCPQDVRFTHIMQILRQLAVEQGYVTPEFVQAIHELDQATERLRIRALAELAKSSKDTAQPDLASLITNVANAKEV